MYETQVYSWPRRKKKDRYTKVDARSSVNTRGFLYFCLLIFVFLIISCKENTPIDVCYPSEGRFLRGEHYIDAEFLSEDGNFHYENILAYYQRHIRSGRPGICIPLEEKPTIEEQIAKIEKTIDLKRK